MKDLSNENVIHIKTGDVEYLQFRRLLEYKNKITHCFTLKNLDFYSNNNFYQNEDKVYKNYEKICKKINLDASIVVRPLQTHTNCVKNIYNEIGILPKGLENVDGLITNQKNKILSVIFADCTPIFLYDPEKNVIGNIHSGWKGTVSKIGKVAIEKMIKDYGCNVQDIIACIGPTIRKCHFEVDADVKEIFEAAFNTLEIIHKGEIKDGKQKYFVDTVLANIIMMKELGLKSQNIIDSNICSVCESDLIHSYRVEGNKAGRCTSLISLI